jgi:hypothetical protein
MSLLEKLYLYFLALTLEQFRQSLGPLVVREDMLGWVGGRGWMHRGLYY